MLTKHKIEVASPIPFSTLTPTVKGGAGASVVNRLVALRTKGHPFAARVRPPL